MARIIKIGVGYGDDIAFFHLNAMNLAEENVLIAELAAVQDLPEKEQVAKEYEICVETVLKKSAKLPTNAQGDAYLPEITDIGEAVNAFFALEDRDVQRLATALLMQYRRALVPKVVF